MRIRLTKILKFILRILLSFLLLIIIYIVAALGLSYIPVNTQFHECKEDCVEIFLLTNGVHTHIVLPIKNEMKDWTVKINPPNTKSGSNVYNYISFGWGDKGFYLETPTWGDLKFKTAFKALFYLSSSAMHVTFYTRLNESSTCKKVYIDRKSYRKIVDYVASSFKINNSGNYQLIRQTLYGDNDLFYDAKGKYSLFYTCNTWTNNLLKAGSLKACLWTPFDKAIIYHYDNK